MAAAASEGELPFRAVGGWNGTEGEESERQGER